MINGFSHCLGAEEAYVLAQRSAAGGKADELFTLAQRIMWGLLLAPMIRVDLDATVKRLLRRHGEHFVAHLLAAVVRRVQKRTVEADAYLQTARSQVTPDHPWASLIPSEDEWALKPEPHTLTESEPNRMWSVHGDLYAEQIAPFGNRNTMNVLRMKSGELVLINPIAMGPELVEQIRGLGQVTHIIAPAKYHHMNAPQAKRHFPQARVYGVPGHAQNPACEPGCFDGTLDDDRPLFPGELTQITMRGVDMGDVVFVDHESGTLLVHDFLFYAVRSAAAEPLFGKLYVWAWGVHDRVGIPAYQPLMWTNLGDYQASVRRILAEDFSKLASSHGGWNLIQEGAKPFVQQSIGWLVELSKLDGARLLGSFVWRHPGFVRDLVGAQLRARRKPSPKSVTPA